MKAAVFDFLNLGFMTSDAQFFAGCFQQGWLIRLMRFMAFHAFSGSNHFMRIGSSQSQANFCVAAQAEGSRFHRKQAWLVPAVGLVAFGAVFFDDRGVG